jgi:hypothetical protein
MAVLFSRKRERGRERERVTGRKQTVKLIPFALAADVSVEVRVVNRWWYLHKYAITVLL